VISSYHHPWQVEKSFRMAKSDLRARPIFHHLHDAIEAHLTVVFAALAISRHLQDATRLSIKRVVPTLRELRSATIDINGQQLTLDPELTPEARDILTALGHEGH
jgi:transposase